MKPTTDKLTVSFETEYFSPEKKTDRVQFKTQDLCCVKHICYSRAVAGNAKKTEYVMKQSRIESRRPNGSCGQSCLRDKI